MRRFGEAVEPGRRYRHRPGVYAILPRDGLFLATWQAEPQPEIQLPGGGIDPGEPPIAALHREVFEETGWHIAGPRHLASYRRFVFMPEYDLWAEKVCHLFVARPVLCLGPPKEKGHLALWLDRAALLAELASPGERSLLARFLA